MSANPVPNVSRSCMVTVLTATGRILAKRHERLPSGAWQTTDFDEARTYTWRLESVEDIETLSALLTRLEGDARSCIIRAQPLPELPAKVRRLIYADRGDGPYFQPHPLGLPWLILDIDKAPVPPPEIAECPCEAAARWAVEAYLPAAFHGVAFHYQWSANAGVKPWAEGLRLHLAFWLSGPACDESTQAWARSLGVVDPSVLRPAQPNFTARPLFVNAPDPVDVRSGLVAGRPCVALDALDGEPLCDADEWVLRSGRVFDLDSDLRAEEAVAKLGSAAVGDRRRAWFNAKVAAAIREIHDLPDGARNDLLGPIVYGVARCVRSAGASESEILRALEDAAEARCADEKAKALDRVRRSWKAGLDDPRDLSHIGAGRPAHAPAAAPGAAEPAAAEQKVTQEDYYCTPSRRLTLGGRAIGEDNKPDKQAVPGIFGAPDPDARVPPGYFISPWATGWHSGDKAGVIVPCPVVVAGRCEDVDSGALQLLIAWKDRGGWRRRLMPRATALSRGVQGLAEWGLPITADGTKALTKFFVDFESRNFDRIPTLRTSHALGWQGEGGGEGFLLGYRHMTSRGESRVDLDRWATDKLAGESVAFQPVDDGDRHFAEGFRVRGTWARWRDACRLLNAYPKAALGVLASLASPLLEVLGARGFAIDWSGPSSSGKSTIMRFAASVYGDPHLLVKVWDASDTYIERLFGTLNSLPFFVDETQRIERGPQSSKQLVSTAIYMAENGHGRGRGSLGHTQVARRWRCILFSTGEQPATTIGDTRGGANARCVQVTGRPFGNGKLESLVRELDDVSHANFGHAGERWVRWLLQNKSRWAEFAERHAELQRAFNQDTESGAESRLAGARAVLELTAELAEEALGLGLVNPIPAVWKLVTAHAADATGERRALEEALGWFATNERSFYNEARDTGREYPTPAPPGGWVGAYSRSYVAFVPGPLEKFLAERGYQVRAVINGWAERQWLQTDKGRTDKKIRFGREARARCVCVDPDILDRVAPEAENTGATPLEKT